MVKSSYRNQIRDLASYSDAAPVKKEYFVQFYHAARDEGLTKQVIRAGWRAAGICPFNIELVVGSLQIQQRPSTPEHQQQPQLSIDPLYATPQKAQDIYRAQQQLRRLEGVTHSTQRVLRKAGKALSAANTRAAALKEENQQLLHKVEAIRPPMPRKRV